MTNSYNGELLNEYISTPSSCSAYVAENNALFPCHSAPALDSWETEGAKIKLEIANGWLRPTGSTTFLGRPAETYVGGAENGRLRMVVDAATDYPLEVAVSFSYGSQTGTQVSTVTAFETLSPAAGAQDVTPKAHPGATTASHHKAPSSEKRSAPKKHKKHKK